MIRQRALVVILALFPALLVGCLPFTSAYARREGSTFSNPFGLRTVAGKDKNVLRYVLLDQPLGDAYLTTKLWSSTLQPLPPEKAAILNENGIRVGIFPNHPPGELLDRINSSQTALKPHEMTLSNSQEKSIPVSGVVPTCRYREIPQLGSDAISRELSNAQFGFVIQTDREDDTRMRLTVVPTAQHGTRQGWLRPTLDETGFNWIDQKKMERFPSLGWELKVSPGDFVVIGATERPAEKMGGAWFVSTETDSPRMHLLILRVWPSPEQPDTSIPGQKVSRTANASR